MLMAIQRETVPYNEAVWGRSYFKGSGEKDRENKNTGQTEIRQKNNSMS